MLHTCLEARQVALEQFKVMPDPRKGLAYPLYFNAEADTLYFGTLNDLIDFLLWEIRGRGIQRIAVGMDSLQDTSTSRGENR